MAKKKASKGAIVHLVLDKSGSMGAITDATIAGVNEFVRQTALADPLARFSLTQFDTNVHKTLSRVDITDVTPLNGRSYRPGGGTALLDGVGAAIKEVDELTDKPDKVVIVIMTDGQENGSREYTRAAIKDLVSKRESEDKWQFLFLGANLDAFAEAGAIGLRSAGQSSATWAGTARGSTAAMMATSAGVGSYLRGQSLNATLTQDSYDAAFASLADADATSPDTTTVPPAVTVDTSKAKPVPRSARSR